MNMQNVLNHVSDRSSHLIGKHGNTNFQCSVRGGYYIAVSYNVIRDVFVLFTFAKVEGIWFDTFGQRPVFRVSSRCAQYAAAVLCCQCFDAVGWAAGRAIKRVCVCVCVMVSD